MACSLCDKDTLTDVILEMFRMIEKDQTIQLDDRLDQDVGLDEEALRGYERPIKRRVERHGCKFSDSFDDDDLADSSIKTVQDVVDLVFSKLDCD